MKRIISDLFEYSGQSHIPLNSKQLTVRDEVKNKIINGLYKQEERGCLCGSKDCVLIAKTDRYGLPLDTVICIECGLIRTNPKLTEAAYKDFYCLEYRDLYMGKEYGSIKNYFDDMVLRGQEILNILLKKRVGIKIEGSDILEIGCSAGGILVPFLESGARVKGYDYDQRYLDYGKQRVLDLDLCYGGVENLKEENRQYDIIILNHVLEHLANPLEAVQLIKEKLKEDGVLYVAVPGLTNLEYFFSPTKSFLGGLHIAHLFCFSPQTLVNTLEGFSPVFIDSKICAIFCHDAKGQISLRFPKKNGYKEAINFINQYEYNHIYRFGLFLAFRIIIYKRDLLRRIYRIKRLVSSKSITHIFSRNN